MADDKFHYVTRDTGLCQLNDDCMAQVVETATRPVQLSLARLFPADRLVSVRREGDWERHKFSRLKSRGRPSATPGLDRGVETRPKTFCRQCLDANVHNRIFRADGRPRCEVSNERDLVDPRLKM